MLDRFTHEIPSFSPFENMVHTWRAHQTFNGTAGVCFRDSLHKINSEIDGEVRLSAPDALQIWLNGVPEARLTSDGLTFDQVGQDVGLEWVTSAQLGVKIDGTRQVYFADAAFMPELNEDVVVGSTALRFKSLHAGRINVSHATDPIAEVGNIYYAEDDKTLKAETDQGIGGVGVVVARSTFPHKISNTTVKTAFNTKHAIPANTAVVGKVFRVTAQGTCNFDATTSVTLTLEVQGVTFLVNTVSQIAVTTGAWFFTGMFTINIIVLGNVFSRANGSMGMPRDEYVNIGNNGLAVISTEASDADIELMVTMSLASASKWMQADQLIIEEVT